MVDLLNTNDAQIICYLAHLNARLSTGVTMINQQLLTDVNQLAINHPTLFIRLSALSFLNSCKSCVTPNTIVHTQIPDHVIVAGMLGQCAGDAIGLVMDYKTQDVCTNYVGQFPKVQESFGQYSVHTQLAREALLTISQMGYLDPAVYAVRMAFVAPTDYKALFAIRFGFKINQVGEPSKNNKSIIRSPPIGWYHSVYDIPVKSILCNSITHTSPNTVEGSIIMALAARYAATTRDFQLNPHHFIATLVTISGYKFTSNLPKYISQLPDMLLSNTSLALVMKQCIQWGFLEGEQDWYGSISDGTVQSLCYALYVFMLCPDDFVAGISIAVQGGGNVCALSAMFGALCGSRVGIDNIPTSWIEPLNDMGQWKPSEMISLIKSCKNNKI